MNRTTIRNIILGYFALAFITLSVISHFFYNRYQDIKATEYYFYSITDVIIEHERLENNPGELDPVVVRKDFSNRLGLSKKSFYTDVGISVVITLIFFIVFAYLLKRFIIQYNEVVASKEEAEAANRTKGEILANMSHELRTPLNAIIGFSDIMTNEIFGPIQNEHYSEYAKHIHTSGTHLLSIINDILDLAKIESGKLQLNEELFDIKRVVKSCMMFVSERAKENGVSMNASVDKTITCIYADERKVKQILVNLLSNAIKFTKQKGRVTVRVFKQNELLHLEVADTGVGISDDDLNKILKPFEQGSNPFKSKVEGTGLGLAIVKGLVDLHDGTLSIESKLDVGTTVSITLPNALSRNLDCQ